MKSVPDLPAPVDGRAEGKRRKDIAHQLLAARRERVVRLGQRALLNRMLTYGTATADDVRAAVALPDGVSPVCLGAAPGALARLCIIRRIGFVESSRACAHARPVSVWELADREAALAWLAAHPPIPAPEAE